MRKRDFGGMSVEMAIMTPVLVGLFLLLVGAGRVVDVKSQLDGAARDGARAAVVARTEGEAQDFAREAVLATLGGTNSCQNLPDSGNGFITEADWRPGGSVTVTVSCVVDLDGLKLGGFTPDITRTGRATAPIDTYRRTE